MAHIVLFMKYPSHVVGKVTQKVKEIMEKNLFPDDESIQETAVLSAWRVCEDGIKALSVTNIKEGKVEEALEMVNKELLFYADIEGYEASVEVWNSYQDALKLMGM